MSFRLGRCLMGVAALVALGSETAMATRIALFSRSEAGTSAGTFESSVGLYDSDINTTLQCSNPLAFCAQGGLPIAGNRSGSATTQAAVGPFLTSGAATSTARSAASIARGQVGVGAQTIGENLSGGTAQGTASFSEGLTFLNETDSTQLVNFVFFGDGETIVSAPLNLQSGWTLMSRFELQSGSVVETFELNTSGDITAGGQITRGLIGLTRFDVPNTEAPLPGEVGVYSGVIGHSTGRPEIRYTVSGGAGGLGSLEWQVEIPLLLAPGESRVVIGAMLQAVNFAQGFNGVLGQGGTSQNFMSTAGVRRIESPNGVSWTSDSGVFLTEIAENPVPEPATGLMMAVAVLFGARYLRRGR